LPSSSRASPRATALAARHPWIAPLLLFLGALLVYGIGLDDGLAVHDELHHILAARGLIATGEPRIAEGLYERGYLYTWLVALSFRLLGDSLGAARLPAVLAMAAVVALLFAWLRREAGGRAAWLAALLFALSPFAVGTAQFARFYALQSLAFLLAALLLQRALLEPAPAWRRLGRAGLALAALGLAASLQPTSLIGGVGLGLWALLAGGGPWLADPTVPSRRRLAVAATGLALLLVAGLGLGLGGELAALWQRYRATPLFLEASRGDFWYYHLWYSLYYPSLWPAVGLLALAGLVAWPRPGLLALVVFATAFLLNSLAGPKNLRYIAYAQPFLFALWGLGIAALWERGRDLLGWLVERLERLPPLPWPWSERLARALVVGAGLGLLVANPAWLRTVTLLADVTVPGEEPNIHWSEARPVLAPLLDRAELVVTTAELETLYHLGRYDLLLNRSRLSELPDAERHEFGRDWRTGRPVISRRDSLALVMDCASFGLIVSPVMNWSRDVHLDEATRELIRARARPVPLPPASRVLAWTWEAPAVGPRPADCARLPAPRPDRGEAGR
jgi:hypothetical protein